MSKKPTHHHNGYGHRIDDPAPPPVAGKSVAEIRENMSRQREREISRNKTDLGDNHRESRRNGDYASLRDKKLAEERLYQGNTHQHFPGHERVEWDEGVQHSKVRFGHGDQVPQSWDREESDLMKWTRNQTRNHGRAQTPPIESPRANRSSSRSSLRSISAPNVAAPVAGIAAAPVAGIAALGGGGVDNHTKRLRQLKYAEELRLQMREKETVGKKPVMAAWRGKSGTDVVHYKLEHGK